MFVILHALGMFVADMFKSQCRLQAENLFLRHQLNVALRRAPSRLQLRGRDRALLIWMTRLWPNLLGVAQVVQPETILRWHRAGFKMFWRWKSRNRAGRPITTLRWIKLAGLRHGACLSDRLLQISPIATDGESFLCVRYLTQVMRVTLFE